MNSWKTTLGGIMLAIGTPLAAAGDGVYVTLGIILATIGGLLTGVAARDNDLTSEESGATAKRARRLNGVRATLAIAPLLLLVMAGCNAVNTASITDAEVATTAQPASLAVMDNEGVQKATFQGVAPTQSKQDQDGTWLTTPGPGAAISFNPATGLIYLWSPKDTRIEGVEVTPKPAAGQPAFKAALIEANLSPVAAVYAAQFKDAMDAIKDMTRAEAEAQVKKMEQARLITSDIAKVLIESVIPLFTK